jgi:hypothetical protein
LGSAFLVFFAIKTNSWPFIILNSVWGLFSLKDFLFFVLKYKDGK